jgi:DNA-binding NarL/FixJ family response regulator
MTSAIVSQDDNGMSAPQRESNCGVSSSLFLSPARLLLCDDQKLIRTRVRQILRQLPAIQVIGEASDGRLAVSMALELKPDIILMDVSMPELNGIQATRQILSQSPGMLVLAYSADTNEHTVRQMFTAGACGFVSKTGDPTELISALSKVLAGEPFFSVQANDAPRWPRLD